MMHLLDLRRDQLGLQEGHFFLLEHALELERQLRSEVLSLRSGGALQLGAAFQKGVRHLQQAHHLLSLGSGRFDIIICD